MNCPQYTPQQKAETDSMLILRQQLKDAGIFRDERECDFGIDLELDVTDGSNVLGHLVHIQVKSSSVAVNVRQDGHPTFGGIKQSTLHYWTELSYGLPIIVIVIDIPKNEISMTRPIFWQATTLLDASNTSKTITFEPEHQPNILVRRLKEIAATYSLPTFINAHKWVLRNIHSIFQLFVDTGWYDQPMEIFDTSTFRQLLEYGQTLFSMDSDFLQGTRLMLSQSFSYQYYCDEGGEEAPVNYITHNALTQILPSLLLLLQKYKDLVISGTFYWMQKDLEYLHLVYDTPIPSWSTNDEMFGQDYDSFFRADEKHKFYEYMEKRIEEFASKDKAIKEKFWTAENIKEILNDIMR